MPNSDPNVICPVCQEVNARFESFCRTCGSPISVTATLDPVSTIQTEGFLFRKALDGPPKPIVLIGTWILFLPLLVVSVGAAIYYILYQRGSVGFFFFWVFVGLTYIAFIILYRVTKNYIVARGQR